MPVDKYKAFYEIVKMLIKMDLTKLRAIEKELSLLYFDKFGRIILSRSSGKKRKKAQARKTRRNEKKPTSAQLRARKQFAMRVRRGDFR